MIPAKEAYIRFYCQKVLPAVYDDSLSYYEVIAKLVDAINEHVTHYNALVGEVGQNADDIAALNDAFNQFMASGFDDYYKAQVETWLSNNLEWIFRDAIKQVYFGLTLDGYFAAYIPESWEDIVFDTGMVYGSEEYGRLILKWDADSPYSVQQP